MAVVADELIAAGQIAANERHQFVENVEDAARHGHFTIRLTMHALVAAAPASED